VSLHRILFSPATEYAREGRLRARRAADPAREPLRLPRAGQADERVPPIVAQQRPDGGWSQILTLDSDAYATGEALVALVESGARAPADPAYTRGVAFLLKTQMADGSWLVRTRAIPIQPYFDAGFPYGKDQFVSAAGTNWATMALAYAATKSGTPPARGRHRSR
jgi:hypothetical protein